jgi:hypothetical protein
MSLCPDGSTDLMVCRERVKKGGCLECYGQGRIHRVLPILLAARDEYLYRSSVLCDCTSLDSG